MLEQLLSPNYVRNSPDDSSLQKALSNSGNAIGNLLGGTVDLLGSMASKSYGQNLLDQERHLRRQENNALNQQYVDEAWGQPKVSGSQTFDQTLQPQQGAQQAQTPQYDQRMVIQEPQQATGFQQHQNPSKLMTQLLSAPNLTTREAAGDILGELLQPHSALSQKIGFDQYQQYTPEQKDTFDRFKGRSPNTSNSGPVNFDQYQGFTPQQKQAFDQFKGRNPDSTVSPNFLSNKDKAGMENTLRDDYRSSIKRFDGINQAYSKISNAKPTGPGDMAMVFSYIKMLDPASTVSQGESGSVISSGSISSQASAWLTGILDGGILDTESRKQIMDQAEAYYQQSQIGQNRLYDDYVANAIDYGLNTRNIVGSRDKPQRPSRQKQVREAYSQEQIKAEMKRRGL